MIKTSGSAIKHRGRSKKCHIYLQQAEPLKRCWHQFSGRNPVSGWATFGSRSATWQTEGSEESEDGRTRNEERKDEIIWEKRREHLALTAQFCTPTLTGLVCFLCIYLSGGPLIGVKVLFQEDTHVGKSKKKTLTSCTPSVAMTSTAEKSKSIRCVHVCLFEREDKSLCVRKMGGGYS
ncbi:hypothetical protein AOLI_G00051390 [Acnodon oligacanthus]